jgi:hypothetical protein
LNNKTTPEKSKPGTVFEFEQLNKTSSKRPRWILEKLPVDEGGVHELYDALVISGMNKLFKVSPASILEPVVDTEGNDWIPQDFCTGVGSLLPFMSGHTTMTAPEYESMSISSHPSVEK